MLARPQVEFDPEFLSYNNGGALMAQVVPFFSLAVIAVLLRCFIRVRSKAFGNDDKAMIAAVVFAVACFTCYMIEISLGLGKHPVVLEANKDRYRDLLKARLLHQVFVVVGLSLVKVSICLLLRRLVIDTWYIRVLWGTIAFLCAFTIACVMTLIFQCLPVAASWDYALRPPPFGRGNAKCFSSEVFKSIGLFNGDFLLAMLPIPFVWGLNRNTRDRISLVFIFSLGILAGVAGIARQLTVGALDEHDAYSIWNFVELHLGIIAASLPALRPLFRQFFNNVRRATSAPRLRGHDNIVMQEYDSKASANEKLASQESILSNHIHVKTTILVRNEQ